MLRWWEMKKNMVGIWMGYEPGYLNWWAFRGSSMGCNSPHRKNWKPVWWWGETSNLFHVLEKKQINKQNIFLKTPKMLMGYRLYFNTNNNFGYFWLFFVFFLSELFDFNVGMMLWCHIAISLLRLTESPLQQKQKPYGKSGHWREWPMFWTIQTYNTSENLRDVW